MIVFVHVVMLSGSLPKILDINQLIHWTNRRDPSLSEPNERFTCFLDASEFILSTALHPTTFPSETKKGSKIVDQSSMRFDPSALPKNGARAKGDIHPSFGREKASKKRTKANVRWDRWRNMHLTPRPNDLEQLHSWTCRVEGTFYHDVSRHVHFESPRWTFHVDEHVSIHVRMGSNGKNIYTSSHRIDRKTIHRRYVSWFVG